MSCDSTLHRACFFDWKSYPWRASTPFLRLTVIACGRCTSPACVRAEYFSAWDGFYMFLRNFMCLEFLLFDVKGLCVMLECCRVFFIQEVCMYCWVSHFIVYFFTTLDHLIYSKISRSPDIAILTLHIAQVSLFLLFFKRFQADLNLNTFLSTFLKVRQRVNFSSSHRFHILKRRRDERRIFRWRYICRKFPGHTKALIIYHFINLELLHKFTKDFLRYKKIKYL